MPPEKENNSLGNAKMEIDEALSDFAKEQGLEGGLSEIKSKQLPTEEKEEVETIKKTSDINESLNEFEAKVIKENLEKPKKEEARKRVDMTEWLVTHSGGLIKSEKQASYVLLGVAAAFFLASFYFFFTGLGGSFKKKTFEIPPSAMIPPPMMLQNVK